MKSSYPQAKNPLILRYYRLMDAFAKSDDERDFYLDKVEGFLLYVDLDKGTDEIEAFEQEFVQNHSRYCLVPKMTFYEVKKFMEGFVHEKVYDIDTKEKLLDIISAKESRENFLEFIYDHLTEFEKWQQYYQERFRIRVIEWLRHHHVQFVFEEDLELNKTLVEKLKRNLFETKVPKDVAQARETLEAKAKTYYSNEALNPRPKRGRPPKQAAKVELEPQLSMDVCMQISSRARPFLYVPDVTASSITFSSKAEADHLRALRGSPRLRVGAELEALSQKLESLRHLSTRLAGAEKYFGGSEVKKPFQPYFKPKFQDSKLVQKLQEEQSPKMESAVETVLVKKRGRPRKDELETEELPPQRRRFAIKKVAQIKTKKK